jgi:pimeloyl-ACP methyl ester carboxylesterase
MHSKSLRRYGTPPVIAAVLHGGPGACGQMAPVARELSSIGGILEPLLTTSSIEGQVSDLRNSIEVNAGIPITLIGYSWGAWLGLIFAARYPALIGKLILVSSGGFGDTSGRRTLETRLKRLGREEAAELTSIIERLGDPVADNQAYRRLERLLLVTDACKPTIDNSGKTQPIDFHPDVFRAVWEEAAQLRSSGELIKIARAVKCPVVAIHGDYDPHPADDVRRPLAAVVKTFQFILLENCGHTPWIEQDARDNFYRILKGELS